jgi:hypothetical protein
MVPGTTKTRGWCAGTTKTLETQHMNIRELLAKIGKGDDLTDEERKEIAVWSPDGELANARKTAEERHAKELAALQIKLEEATEALEARSTEGATEAEKLKLQLEKATKAREAAEKKYAEAQELTVKAQRSSQIDAIVGGIQWADEASRRAGRVLIERDLVDVTDLTAEADVTPIVDAAKASILTRLMAAAGTTGTGVRATTGTGTGKGAKDPILFSPDMFKGKTAEERAKILADMRSQPDPEMQASPASGRVVMRAAANASP